MKLAVVGTGYVGLVAGACFAEMGNTVTCIDVDRRKITLLKKGAIPIYEPGLDDIVRKNIREKRLSFTTQLREGIKSAQVIMLALPTPPNEDGAADLRHVLSVAEQIGRSLKEYKVIVNKSTVPVGTVARVTEIIRSKTRIPFDVVSNPEFLKEGSAVDDFMKPDRIVVGASTEKAIAVMKQLYEPFIRTGNPFIVMDEASAELTKYAANSLLATKISFMNEVANLAELVGADVDKVRIGVGSDPRIGKSFLFPGVGYGGSCFPKDVKALIKTGERLGCDFKILKAVEEVNFRQKRSMIPRIKRHFANSIEGKTFAIWGLAFKPKTDDIREAPSIVIIQELLKLGARIQAHDPVAMNETKRMLGAKIKYCSTPYEALRRADALIIVTEWNEFREPDYDEMKEIMRGLVIFDGRNILNVQQLRSKGFAYYGIGRR
jgi:UDPglucose 6-dehydrogenase